MKKSLDIKEHIKTLKSNEATLTLKTLFHSKLIIQINPKKEKEKSVKGLDIGNPHQY